MGNFGRHTYISADNNKKIGNVGRYRLGFKKIIIKCLENVGI